MEPSDKERAQPTNVDSAATPLSKRRQPSSDETGTDQQSAAASAYPTGPTGAPAVADSVAAGHSASAASRISPAERCPSDPLSVVLSFLNARDFAVASRVCRHWRQATELQSSWPDFSVERLISGLIEDEDHWTQSRSARVNAKHLRADAVQRLAQSAKWRRLSELYLYGFPNTSVSLREVAQLSQLQSLCLSWVCSEDVAAGFGSLAPRLQALKCDSPSISQPVQPHLHLLVNLRVLVMHYTIDGQALLLLHQLEFLQLRFASMASRDLLLAIRRLSVQYRLRHVSVTSYANSPLDLDPLVAELSGADSGFAPAALLSIRVFGNLSDASRSALLSLPNLTRLHWKDAAAVSQSPAPSQSSLPPSPLRRLHLDFKSDERGAVHLLQLAAVRAPQLRELHMGRLPPSMGQLVQPLRSLHQLDIALPESSELSQELLQALATLPLLTELVVRQSAFEPTAFQLSVETLRCISESRSWRRIRLVDEHNPLQLILPDDVDARLAERLADFRVRSEWRHNAVVRRLIISAHGATTWTQTAI